MIFAEYEYIYNYLKLNEIKSNDYNYPKRIIEIKSKSKKDNAKKVFSIKAKKYKIFNQNNILYYKKQIIVNFNIISLYKYIIN